MPSGIYKRTVEARINMSLSHKGHKPSKETRIKMSKSKMGKYKKVLKKSDRKWLDSAYMSWSKKIKDRDNWKCKIADKNCKSRLESHHILPWRNYPELRYEINNGITLCRYHHPRKYSEEVRLSPYFQEMISNKEII